MSARLTGKMVLVTAAAQGIGRACALAAAAEGASVIATDINGHKLADMADVASVTVRPLDVTDRTAVVALADELPPLDGLVNCAGFVHAGTILTASDDDWENAWSLNVRAMAQVIKAFLPKMLTHGGGSIVNIASVASSVKAVPNRCVYGTTKAAVIGLTKSVAADFIRQGIRCNAICPGTVQSPSLEDRLHALGDYDRARAEFVARQPMGRLGEPAEIAELAVHLLGDRAAFTTGQIHLADGGMAM